MKIVVPHAAGDNSDAFARIVAQRLSERLGQSVVVENRTGAGAGGTIACASVARAPADGDAVVVADDRTHAVAPQRYGSRLQYDVFKDFTPVSLAATFPTVLLLHPSVPASTPREFVALAKSQPGKLTDSSAGTGDGSHLAQTIFLHAAGGLDMIHVPYKGGAPAIQALIAGAARAGDARRIRHRRRRGRQLARSARAAEPAGRRRLDTDARIQRHPDTAGRQGKTRGTRARSGGGGAAALPRPAQGRRGHVDGGGEAKRGRGRVNGPADGRTAGR